MGWIRHPHTTQERREWFEATDAAKEWPQLRLRRARASSNLPQAWDDVPKLNGDDRSWKLHRAAQWDVRRTEKRRGGKRGQFDTPIVMLHKSPFWCWGWRTKVDGGMHPYRVRFKYIKNKTA
jgi:hypothetical protein